MKIPDDKIDEIRAATDIVDLIGGFVKLRKRGKNHIGLCPFHKEKTPSFNVSAERQMYHCFGCGVGGNVFTFLMQYEKVSFVEAVRSLAKPAGIEPPAPGAGGDSGEPTEQDRAGALCRLAALHFHHNLTETQEGKLALEYLKHRGISEAMTTHFGLGYALNSWDAFLAHAGEHAYAHEFIEKYGLARRREDGGYYDYFRGRLIFPVFTAAGRVVGFGARKLREDDPLGKYINSPDSPVYNKSRILYGLFQSKEAIREADSAILVEGYLDLISVYQAGIKNIIASSGTALTEEQTQLVRRYTKNITIVYDADSAGSKAAMRGVDVVLAQDMDVRVAKLPEGEDPDSFVRKEGAAGFRKLLEGSMSFIDFIIDARKEKDASPEERSKTIRILVGTVANMPDALKRDLYVKHIAEKFAVRESVLAAELSAKLRTAAAPPPGRYAPAREEMPVAGSPAGAGNRPAGSVPGEEKDLFAAVLRGGENVARFVLGHVAPEEFSHPVTRAIAGLLSERLEEGESIDAATLIDSTDDPAGREFISEIMLTKYELKGEPRPGTPVIEQGEPLRIARDTVVAMKKRNLRALKKENQELLKKESDRGGDVVPYLRRNTLLDEELARLEKEGLGG
jgi:DNA primase